MPKTTFAGHPLHPQDVIFPAALLPFAGVLDVLYWLTGKAGFAQSAYYSLIGDS